MVHLHGQLVDGVRDDGASVRTSLTRTDSGAGACEICWSQSRLLRAPAARQRPGRVPPAAFRDAQHDLAEDVSALQPLVSLCRLREGYSAAMGTSIFAAVIA